jgi:GNAT superfamily N-acetyltransferase
MAFDNIYDCLRVIDKYRNLKRGELDAVEDIYLKECVMSWLWGKIWDRPQAEFDIINALPRSCRSIYSCVTVLNELESSGFSQLFANIDERIISLAKEGFYDIKADVIGDILCEALDAFESRKEDETMYEAEAAEENTRIIDLDALSYYDDLYHEEAEKINMEQLMIAFIRKYSDSFGDIQYSIIQGSQEDIKEVQNKIMQYNDNYFKDSREYTYCIKCENGNLIAAIIAQKTCNSIQIQFLWVDELYRHKGLGKVLLEKVEQTARQEAVNILYLYVYGFQSLDFYLKNGYTIFGQLKQCIGKFDQYFLKKEL